MREIERDEPQRSKEQVEECEEKYGKRAIIGPGISA